MIKRFAAIVLVLAICFSFVSCKGKSKHASGKIKVVSTVFPTYDFARQIGKNKIELKMLVKPGTDVHSYEPSVSDISAVRDCDLLLCTGGVSDAWLNDILKGVSSPAAVVRMCDCADLLSEEELVSFNKEHEHEEDEEFDEHIWTSPLNAIKISNSICKALCQIDKANSRYYKSNCTEYTALIQDLYNSYSQKFSSVNCKHFTVADRFPFLYLANCFDLPYYAAFGGCTASEDPSVKTVSYLIDKVKSQRIPTVYYIEFSNRAIASTVCEATGAKPALLHSCHNLSPEDFRSGVTYYELMKSNLESLWEAVQ